MKNHNYFFLRNSKFESYHFLRHITVVIITFAEVAVSFSGRAENQQEVFKICNLRHVRVVANTFLILVILVHLFR